MKDEDRSLTVSLCIRLTSYLSTSLLLTPIRLEPMDSTNTVSSDTPGPGPYPPSPPGQDGKSQKDCERGSRGESSTSVRVYHLPPLTPNLSGSFSYTGRVPVVVELPRNWLFGFPTSGSVLL